MILSIKNANRLGLSISVGQGEGTLFWLDYWFGEAPLASDFHALFSICLGLLLFLGNP